MTQRPHEPEGYAPRLSPSASSGLPDPLPLVGRAAELATLEQYLEGSDHSPRLVFIRGEGGVGKTRLVAELAARARARGWDVARGRAYPVEAGTPYSIFSDAWLPLLTSMESSTLTVLSRGGEAELRCLFPALGSGDQGAMLDPESGEPDELRTRLMWNFAEFVKRYAARSPLLCVLEDLQWADESSIELMHFLARQTQEHPVLLVCTYNDQERDRAATLVQAERSLTSMGVGSVLHLDALTRDQVGELVSRSFGTDSGVVRDFAAVLFGWTRGNPFFVEEIIKALVETGRLRTENGIWVGWSAKEFGMPSSIRDAILGRVAAFSDAARTAVEMSAIVGTRASYALLESVTGLEPMSLLAALEELCATGVLSERTDGQEVVYDFRHPLVRQTLYEEFGLQRARVLHGVVAEAMESHYGAFAEQHADELAYHFARTDGSRLKGKAARYLLSAGRRALERRADTEAINYLESALDRTEPEAEHGPESPVAVIVQMLARAHTHVGHFDAAAELWSAALEHAAPATPEYARICRALGITNVWRGRHDEAMRWLEAGLEASAACESQVATVRLLIAKAHALHEVGRGTDALEALGLALPVAQAVGDRLLLARVHRALTLLHVWVGPPEKAVEHGAVAIGLAREVDNLAIEFWARWGLAVLAGMRGNTEALATAIEDVNEIADRARSPVLRLWTADMSVELAYSRGDWDAGIAMGDQAISLARSLNQRTLLPRLLVWTSQFHGARGDLDRAAALVEEAVVISGIGDESREVDVHQVVPTYIGLALYLVHLGDYEEAIDAAEKGLRIAEGTGYVLWAIHQLLPALAEACLWAGHIDRAAEVGQRMRDHAEAIDHRIGRAWADACDALVRWKRGDTAGSIDLMRSAADELTAIPMIWSGTRLRRQLAGRLFELDRREEALEQLAQVHDVCMKVRAGIELEKTRAMYRQMGLRPPPVRSEDGPLGLTPSEFNVARLVSEGMSNKAIAAQLRCATRTVSTHLSNIYVKLEIGGPGARMRLGNLIRGADLGE